MRAFVWQQSLSGGELEDQIAWLVSEQGEALRQEAAVEHVSDLWADRDRGIRA